MIAWRDRSGAFALLGCAVLVMGVVTGCRSTADSARLTDEDLARARRALDKPMPGSVAALYHLRVPSSGGLKLSVVWLEEAGRMTISEPFGSTAAVAHWDLGGTTRLYDLKEGCRIEGGDLSSVLGVAAVPLPAAVRLLYGRLPATPGDDVVSLDDGRIRVAGEGWSAFVTVQDDPWRVVRVDGPGGDASWKLWLEDHSGSVPGWLRVERGDGRWAELELVRLEQDTVTELPSLPTFPECGEKDD